MTSPSEHLPGLRRQNEELKEKISKLESKQIQQDQKIKRLDKDFRDALDVKDLLKNKLKECKSRLDSAIAKCERQQEKIEKIEKLDKGKNKEDVDDETIQRLKDELEEARNKIGELRTSIKLKKHVEFHDEDRKKDLDKALETIEELKHDEENQRKTIDQLKQRLRDEQEEKEKLEKTVKTLKQDQAKSHHHMRELDDDNPRLLKVEVRLAEKKVKDIEARLKFVRDVMLKEEKEAKEALQKKLDDIEEQRKEKDERVQEKEETVERLESEVTNLKKKLEAKEEKLEQMQKVEEESEEVKKKLDRVQRELKMTEVQIESKEGLEKNYNTMKHNSLELQDQVKDYERLLAKLESKLETLTRQNEEMKETRKKERDISESQSLERIGKLNEKISSLEKEKSELKRDLEKFGELRRKLVSEHEKEIEDYQRELEGKIQAIHEMTRLDKESRKQFDLLTQECTRVMEQNLDLKEQVSERTSSLNEVKETNYHLQCAVQELADKVSSKNEELNRYKNKLEGKSSQLEQKDIETHTQISQLKKLVDHLQTKADEKKSHSHKSKHLIFSYEELQEELENERKKNIELRQQIVKSKTKTTSSTSVDEVKEIAKKDLVAESNHSIPHRFQKQTNMKVTKCMVCHTNIQFCKPCVVCKFCHRIAHAVCEKSIPDDCGLSDDLALVLKTRVNDQNTFVSHKGYLKVPETQPPGKRWSKVGVQIVRNKLVLDSKPVKEINLQPSEGHIYIHGTVAFAETVRANIYEKPLIFKIGYTSGSKVRESHYFMAKTLQEKAAWIEAIEKVTLQPPRNNKINKLIPSPSKSISKCKVLTTFPSDTTLFCAVKSEYGRCATFFGTSRGLFFVEDNNKKDLMQFVEFGPESVFQMEYLSPEYGDFLMIIESSRELAMIRRKDIFKSAKEGTTLMYRNLEVVTVCHLFALGIIEEAMYLCAVDDGRVSILSKRRSGPEEFEMEYGFSTDQPTSSIAFTKSSVLVMTDKIYEINLINNFEVREFLDPANDLTFNSIFVENSLIGIFPMNNEKLLLCFQDFGVVADENGTRIGEDLKWTDSASQAFKVSHSDQIWLGYHNLMECFDLEKKSAVEKIGCRNCQILSGRSQQEKMIFVDKKSDVLVVMEYNESI